MLQRRIAVLVPALLLALTPVAGATTAPHSYRVKLRGVIYTTAVKGPVRATDSEESDVGSLSGTIAGKIAGDGAWLEDSVWESNLKLVSTGTLFETGGSMTFLAFTNFTATPSGGFTYSGSLRVTKGTRAYKGAHGKLRISGKTLASDPAAATISIIGKLK
jgi:hypothetical protein